MDFHQETFKLEQIKLKSQGDCQPASSGMGRPPQHSASDVHSKLLAVSNRFGLLVNSLGKGFTITSIETLVDGINSENYPTTINTKGQLVHLCFNYDDSLLICADKNNTLFAYQTERILSGDSTPVHSMQLSDPISQVLPNPESSPTTIAVLLNTGIVRFISGTTLEPITIKNITHMCWSLKGKQLACTTFTGDIQQISLQGNIMNTIKACPQYVQEYGVPNIDHVIWIENKLFLVVYKEKKGENIPQTCMYIVQQDASKPPTTTYTKISDPCFNSIENIKYNMCLIRNFGPRVKYLIILASTACTDVCGIAYSDYDNDVFQWGIWEFPEGSNITMPLTSNDDDTYPIALSIDYTSKIKLPNTSVGDPPFAPCPRVWVKNDVGQLFGYWLLNTEATSKDETCAMTEIQKIVPRVATKVSSKDTTPFSLLSTPFSSMSSSIETPSKPEALKPTISKPSSFGIGSSTTLKADVSASSKSATQTSPASASSITKSSTLFGSSKAESVKQSPTSVSIQKQPLALSSTQANQLNIAQSYTTKFDDIYKSFSEDIHQIKSYIKLISEDISNTKFKTLDPLLMSKVEDVNESLAILETSQLEGQVLLTKQKCKEIKNIIEQDENTETKYAAEKKSILEKRKVVYSDLTNAYHLLEDMALYRQDNRNVDVWDDLKFLEKRFESVGQSLCGLEGLMEGMKVGKQRTKCTIKSQNTFGIQGDDIYADEESEDDVDPAPKAPDAKWDRWLNRKVHVIEERVADDKAIIPRMFESIIVEEESKSVTSVDSPDAVKKIELKSTAMQTIESLLSSKTVVLEQRMAPDKNLGSSLHDTTNFCTPQTTKGFHVSIPPISTLSPFKLGEIHTFGTESSIEKLSIQATSPIKSPQSQPLVAVYKDQNTNFLQKSNVIDVKFENAKSPVQKESDLLKSPIKKDLESVQTDEDVNSVKFSEKLEDKLETTTLFASVSLQKDQLSSDEGSESSVSENAPASSRLKNEQEDVFIEENGSCDGGEEEVTADEVNNNDGDVSYEENNESVEENEDELDSGSSQAEDDGDKEVIQVVSNELVTEEKDDEISVIEHLNSEDMKEDREAIQIGKDNDDNQGTYSGENLNEIKASVIPTEERSSEIESMFESQETFGLGAKAQSSNTNQMFNVSLQPLKSTVSGAQSNIAITSQPSTSHLVKAQQAASFAQNGFQNKSTTPTFGQSSFGSTALSSQPSFGTGGFSSVPKSSGFGAISSSSSTSIFAQASSSLPASAPTTSGITNTVSPAFDQGPFVSTSSSSHDNSTFVNPSAVSTPSVFAPAPTFGQTTFGAPIANTPASAFGTNPKFGQSTFGNAASTQVVTSQISNPVFASSQVAATSHGQNSFGMTSSASFGSTGFGQSGFASVKPTGFGQSGFPSVSRNPPGFANVSGGGFLTTVQPATTIGFGTVAAQGGSIFESKPSQPSSFGSVQPSSFGATSVGFGFGSAEISQQSQQTGFGTFGNSLFPAKPNAPSFTQYRG